MRLTRPLLEQALLFEHFFEARLLLGCRHREKLIFGLLHLLADFWADWLHDLFGALLAFADDVINLIALIRSKVQLAFGATKEFDPDNASGATGGERPWLLG